MMKKIVLSTLLVCFFGVHVVAQEVLTLKQCRELALKNNKSMAVSAKQIEAARLTMNSYRGNFFPNIKAEGLGFYSSMDGSLGIAGGNLPTFVPGVDGQMLPNNGFAYFPGLDLKYKLGWIYTGGISVEQPLFMGGKIMAAYKMAKMGHSLSILNERLTTTEVVLKTDEAYAGVVKAQEMSVVAKAYNELLKELMSNVRNAFKHGLKSQNDILKVQVKLNESELNMRKAENALRLATMNLCHYIGKPIRSELKVSSDLPEVGAVSPESDITKRPEYAMLNHQVNIAGQEVRLTRSEMLPQIGVRGSYNYSHGLKVNDQYFLNNGGFSVMLNVSIPLFHFGERSNKLKAAKVKLDQLKLEQQDKNEQMLLELTLAENNLDEAQLEKKLAEKSLEQAAENMRISKKQFDAGLETLSDHLEAQLLWQQAYEVKIDASFQVYLKYIAYLKASGTLTETLNN